MFGSYAWNSRATQILWAPTSRHHDVLGREHGAQVRDRLLRLDRPAVVGLVGPQVAEQLLAEVGVDEDLA